MSAAEIKEIISFGGIGLLILAIALIQLSRKKLTGIISGIVSFLAYICLIVGGLIVLFIVISGPTGSYLGGYGMKKSVFMLVLLPMTLVTLTGCLYPQDELTKNKIPNEEKLEMVQTAILQYMDETDGLLPINTKDNDVDDYEKYLIDFNMLKERQLISEPPGTAYENGGVYQYGVVTPEEDPRVKL